MIETRDISKIDKQVDNKEIWQVDDQVRYRRLFDEGVLIHLEQPEAIVLNDTAMSFLELCDGIRTTESIIEEMTQQYEVTSEALAVDLAPLIDNLASSGIIRRVKVSNA